MHRLNKRGRLPVLVLLFFGGFAAPAFAFNVGPWMTGTDDFISASAYQLTSTFHTEFHDVLALLNASDLSTSHTHDTTSRELVANDLNYGNPNFFGWAECHAYSGVRGFYNKPVCTQAHVHIDLTLTGSPNPPGSSYSATEAQSLMCEEVGHSVGLHHSGESGSCMSQNWATTGYTSHDISIINLQYG